MLGGMFASCWDKIGRANHHIDALTSEILEWRDTKPYRSVKKTDAQGRRHSIAIEVRNQPGLERWALFAGDTVHNLRSALDHFVYAAACRETKQTPPPVPIERTIQFPIADSPDAFAKMEWRIKPLSDTTKEAIKRIQPYNRPHADFPSLLGLLRDFDDLDKHRLLNVVMANVAQGRLSFAGDNPQELVPVQLVHHSGSIEHGTEIVWFIVDPPKPDLDYHHEMSVVISLTHEAGRTGRTFTEIVPMLHFLRDEAVFVLNEVGIAL